MSRCPNIEAAAWDSAFFGYPIGRAVFPHDYAADSLASDAETIVAHSRERGFKLTYVFLEFSVEAALSEILTRKGFRNVGGKREYQLDLSSLSLDDAELKQISHCRHVTPPLVELAMQSGAFSRFKLDSGFLKNEFEKLYREWIRKAVEETPTHSTFIHGADDHPQGFISVDADETGACVGLLAVAPESRRLGIGRTLLRYAEKHAVSLGYDQMRVATQTGNPACAFYESEGFHCMSETAIFHLWL